MGWGWGGSVWSPRKLSQKDKLLQAPQTAKNMRAARKTKEHIRKHNITTKYTNITNFSLSLSLSLSDPVLQEYGLIFLRIRYPPFLDQRFALSAQEECSRSRWLLCVCVCVCLFPFTGDLTWTTVSFQHFMFVFAA